MSNWLLDTELDLGDSLSGFSKTLLLELLTTVALNRSMSTELRLLKLKSETSVKKDVDSVYGRQEVYRRPVEKLSLVDVDQ